MNTSQKLTKLIKYKLFTFKYNEKNSWTMIKTSLILITIYNNCFY